MGHPATLSEAQIAEVETLAAVLTAEQISDYFCIGRRTFYSIMERDEEVAARYKRGKARAVGSVAQNLIAKARAGNVTAMIFYLKTQGGWRETDRLELSGPDGGNIAMSTVEEDAAAFTARINRLMERATGAEIDRLADFETGPRNYAARLDISYDDLALGKPVIEHAPLTGGEGA